jgi:hypothetical protein
VSAEGWAELRPLQSGRGARWPRRTHYFLAGVSLCGKRRLEEQGHAPTVLELELDTSGGRALGCAKCRARSSSRVFRWRRAHRLRPTKGTVSELEAKRPLSGSAKGTEAPAKPSPYSAAELLEELEPGRIFFGRDGRRFKVANPPTAAASKTAAGYRVRYYLAGTGQLHLDRPGWFLRHRFRRWE